MAVRLGKTPHDFGGFASPSCGVPCGGGTVDAVTRSLGTSSLVSPLIIYPAGLHLVAAWPHVNDMGYNCGPGSCGTYSGRRYMTKEERTELLREYQKELENELQGVKERIEEIAAE